jgi:hypothetical protein
LFCDGTILDENQTGQERKDLRATISESRLQQGHNKLALRFDTAGVVALQQLRVQIR